MKTLYIVIILFLTLVILSPRALAQQVSFTTSPAYTDIVTKPGKTIYQDITITNSGDPQVYTLRLYSLEVADALGNFRIKPTAEASVSVVITAPYIRLDKPFLMQSHTQETLPVRIDVPETVSGNGEYHFAIVAESEKPIPTEGTINSRISAGLGNLFFIRVLNENSDDKKVEVSLFQAITQFSLPFGKGRVAIMDSNKPIPFVLMLKNKGEHTVLPKGSITLKNLVNKQQSSFSVLPVYAYPGKDRIMPASSYHVDECVKKYNAACSKEYSMVHPGYTFGLIQASSKIIFGPDSPVIYANDFFIVVPFVFIWLFIISTILILVLLVVWWRKHLREAKKHKNHS